MILLLHLGRFKYILKKLVLSTFDKIFLCIILYRHRLHLLDQCIWMCTVPLTNSTPIDILPRSQVDCLMSVFRRLTDDVSVSILQSNYPGKDPIFVRNAITNVLKGLHSLSILFILFAHALIFY